MTEVGVNAYRTKHGEWMGDSLLAAGKWANERNYLSSIFLDRGGDEPMQDWTDVTSDVWDALDHEAEEGKDEVTILREALQQLSQAFLRHTLEAARELESLKARMDQLENPNQ